MSDTIRVDLPVDLNTMDDTGLPWAFLDRAIDPTASRSVFTSWWDRLALAVAQVVDVADGIVHVRPLRGSVASNAHLLDPRRIAS